MMQQVTPAQQPMMQQPMMQQPMVQQPMVQQPMVQQPMVQQPMMQQQMTSVVPGGSPVQTDPNATIKATPAAAIGNMKENMKMAKEVKKNMKVDWITGSGGPNCLFQSPFPCAVCYDVGSMLGCIPQISFKACSTHIKYKEIKCFAGKEITYRIKSIDKSEKCGGAYYTVETHEGKTLVLPSVNCAEKLDEIWNEDARIAAEAMMAENQEMAEILNA